MTSNGAGGFLGRDQVRHASNHGIAAVALALPVLISLLPLLCLTHRRRLMPLKLNSAGSHPIRAASLL